MQTEKGPRTDRKLYVPLPPSAFDALIVAATREDRGLREQARHIIVDALRLSGYLDTEPGPFRAVPREPGR